MSKQSKGKKSRRLNGYTLDNEFDLRRYAIKSGHMEYGNGGLTKFLDDFFLFALNENNEFINEFVKINQKLTVN